MRDLRGYVQQQLAPLALPPARERKVVDEWAAQIEEQYDALRAEGLADEDAWSELQRQMPDWAVLRRELADAEPVLVRVAAPASGPLAGPAKRRFVAAARDAIAAGLLRDLSLAVRLLFKDRAFSAAVILTLAVCVGANAAIFTVVRSVLLRPLPIPDADRIVGIGDVYPTITPNDILSNDVPSYFDRLAAVTALESQALFTFWFDTIAVDGAPEEIRGMRTTASLFKVLQVAPAVGRVFTEDDAEPGREQKIILSYGLWQRLYAGSPRAIGTDLRLGWTGKPYTIVGVMPQGFTFFNNGYDGHARGQDGVQFWIPLVITPAQRADTARTRYGFFHLGRLRPDASLEQVRAQVDAVTQTNIKRFPQFRLAELGMYSAVTPLQEALTRDVRRVLYLLWGGATLVLLIGAINLANLALVRATVRRRELATRLSLGAHRLHVARQLVVEGMVPAIVGGAAGLALAVWGIEILAATELEGLPNAADVRIDGAVVAFVALVSAIVGASIGLVPAVAVRSAALASLLSDGSRLGTAGRSTRLLRQGLVVAQVALSVVLLAGAALLGTSFRHLLSIDAGFTPARVATATYFPPPSRYANQQAVAEMSDRLLAAVRALPDVEAAGITTNIALSGHASPSTVSAVDREARPDDAVVVPSVIAISPGYFEAMRTRLVRGRYFADSDRADAARVAIVDERLAARFWPTMDPIGRTIRRGESDRYTVVGVVADVHFASVSGDTETIGTAYFPHTQAPPMGRLRWLAIRTRSDAANVMRAARTTLAAIDPDLPLADVQTMTERTNRSLGPQSLALRLTALFGIVALLLSMLGLYGVLAYVVAQRRREIGIRMALGGTSPAVFRLVFSEGAMVVAAGLALGLVGAAASGRLLRGQLFGVAPNDPIVLITVAAFAGVIALIACVAPAVRAARLNPVSVLHEG